MATNGYAQMDRQEIQDVIAENEARSAELTALYNPVSGEGTLGTSRADLEAGVGERFPLRLDADTVWLLPASMRSDPTVRAMLEAGSLDTFARLIGEPYQTTYAALKELRYTHDFEFWCAACVTIETKADGHQPFLPNRPQRRLLRAFEAMRLAGDPIRVVLLKARQWGGSTLTQIYMAWIQLRHKRHWNSFICSLDKGSATRIRGMYSLLGEKYPADVGTVTFKPYEGGQNTKVVVERECIVGVASVERPDAVRGYTYQMLHLSEVGLWPSTEQVNAESFAQSLAGALVDAPYSFCVLESTAKGIGNFFHRMWQTSTGQRRTDGEAAGEAAADPAGAYQPVFVAWFDSEEYQTPIAAGELEAFVRSLTEYEWMLWELGASLEQIAWYRRRRQQPGMDDEWRLKSEFPSTPDEAFQSSGHRYFPKRYVQNGRDTCEPPAAVGYLHAAGTEGKAALEDLHFEDGGGRGFLRVWTPPHQAGIERPGYTYTNRYVAFADVGGTTEKADFSTVKVIDRIFTLWGGKPYVAAVWHGHLDQDLFAWEAARLARWYDNALLAVEVNSLRKDSGDEIRGFEASHALTVLDEIRDYYDNLFYRVEPEKDHDRYSGVLGFHTNQKTKPLILSALKKALRDELYEERDERACDELDYYEIKADGSFGAVAGQHDDRVITTAGAVWLALNHLKDRPVAEVPVRRPQRRRHRTAADFS